MKVLTPSESRQLLDAVNVHDAFGARNRALLVLMLHTGLRVSELVALDVDNVSVDGVARQSLYVSPARAKGGRDRTIPLNETARQAIVDILNFNQRRGFSVEADRPLFVTRKHQRMNVRAVQRLVEGLREKARLDVPAVPHTLRHAFATNVLAATGNLRIVQIALGHKRLFSVEIYTHPTREDVRAAVDTIARQA
ncbi:MAG: tyrosine-type recombinase/integrase [bacterium]|nr:tyrosine-type recombinase/integrase [bacterium]